jgi:hypothetical protein
MMPTSRKADYDKIKYHPDMLEGKPRHYYRVFHHWRSQGVATEVAVRMALMAYSDEAEYQRLKQEVTFDRMYRATMRESRIVNKRID